MTEFDATKFQIIKRGYWKVTVSPIKFEKERIKDLSEILRIVGRCQISIRGWNYPHFHEAGQSYGGTSVGSDFIQSITNFKYFIELWRLYQSGLFVHEFACPEDMWPQTKDSNVLEILDTLYRMTEIYKFASNLAINDVFGNNLLVGLELNNMQNRSLLFLDPRRDLHANYRCQTNQLTYSETLTKSQIIAEANEIAVQRSKWIFQRFNWLSENVIDFLRGEQESFLKGKLSL